MSTDILTITVDPDRISLRQMRDLERAKTIDATVAAICAITGLTTDQALDIRPGEMRQLKQAIKAAWDSATNDPN
jgi:hypothetical protein